MRKGLKISLIFVISLIFTALLVVDVRYMHILLNGKEKVVSKTFHINSLTLSDGTQQDIVEVRYFANKDNSGRETFEIKFNYFVDENKTDVYSQGLQFVAEENGTINIEFSLNCLTKTYSHSTGWWLTKTNYYNYQSQYLPSETTETYNYAGMDGEYLQSTNPLNLKSFFKINIGEQLYLMQFKGTSTPQDLTTYLGSDMVFNDFDTDVCRQHYFVYDVFYFSKLLYESVKSADLGTDASIVFEYGNLFNYYAYNSDEEVYEEEATEYDHIVKMSGDIKSYYYIKVNTYEYGLNNSQDSLFGSFLGNQNYNASGNYSSGDYFIGRDVINLGYTAFDFVTVSDNNVALKLSDKSIANYLPYKDKIMLSVVIDTDAISALGYNFVGFVEDNGLQQFNLYECYSISGNEKLNDYIAGGLL